MKFYDKVIIDDKQAAYEAVQSLIDKGRKKIALVTTVDYVSVGKLRTGISKRYWLTTSLSTKTSS
jgi:DNA-binding LacI/PurR family transcriptional regulator